MFIKIENVNYFVIPDNKNVSEIYEEIFSRMEVQKITNLQKRKILSQIKKQIKR
nr:MAG: hypothetical protein [Caudoviricetes sp.]